VGRERAQVTEEGADCKKERRGLEGVKKSGEAYRGTKAQGDYLSCMEKSRILPEMIVPILKRERWAQIRASRNY